MKKILLSIVALSALASAGQGKNRTEVDGKAQLYYYTTDEDSLFSEESTSAAGAVTLNVSHKVSDSILVNFTAIGYDSLGSSVGSPMEGAKHTAGSYFGNANIALNMDKTTLIVGRQQLDTPMLGSFDWLLAPSHFEATTLVQKSNGLTMVASYVKKLRANNSGTEFVKLADKNYAIGMIYSGIVDANMWYYNIDAKRYTQIYTDASEKRSNAVYSIQVVSTDYDLGDDSMAYGIKLESISGGWNFSFAYNKIEDREVGFVEVDSLYTSSWNSWASTKLNNSFKLEFSEESGSVATTLSYAKYDDGDEMDIILGYQIAKNISFDTIFTNTKYTDNSSASKALEFIGTYKF
jgi:hypothetical protein